MQSTSQKIAVKVKVVRKPSQFTKKSSSEKLNVPKKRVPRRTEAVTIMYAGKTFRIPPLFQEKWVEKNEDRTLLNDTLIEFYLCYWMRNNIYSFEAKKRVHVFHSFFFSKLKLRFSKYFKDGPPRRSELADHYNRFFDTVNPDSILKKEFLILPVHLERPKHWFLILVHNPAGAIRRFTAPPTGDECEHRKRSLCKRVVEFVQVEEKTSECRVLIMDSLCHSEKYKAVLTNSHSHAFDYIRLWLQMAAASQGLELMTGRVRRVLCQSLPQQSNSVDCGVYMMAFAEYFTWYNTGWVDSPTDSLAYLKMDEDLVEFLNSSQPRNRLDALVQKHKIDPNDVKDL